MLSRATRENISLLEACKYKYPVAAITLICGVALMGERETQDNYVDLLQKSSKFTQYNMPPTLPLHPLITPQPPPPKKKKKKKKIPRKWKYKKCCFPWSIL